jgi:phosphinothricin acetyltransferase
MLTTATLPAAARAGAGRLTVARADPGHVVAITTIYRDHLARGLGTHEDPVPDAAEMGRRLAAVTGAGLPALVALDARGVVRGFAWARPWRERAGYRGTVEDSIYVAREARRQGVGRLLLGRLVQACTALGCRAMIAVVGDARNRASIRLHESLGFEVCGLLRGAGSRPLPGGGELAQDVVLLQRALAGATAAGRA